MAFRAYETVEIQSNLIARDGMKYPEIAEKRGIESLE